jgi:hypothetical protein
MAEVLIIIIGVAIIGVAFVCIGVVVDKCGCDGDGCAFAGGFILGCDMLLVGAVGAFWLAAKIVNGLTL